MAINTPSARTSSCRRRADPAPVRLLRALRWLYAHPGCSRHAYSTHPLPATSSAMVDLLGHCRFPPCSSWPHPRAAGPGPAGAALILLIAQAMMRAADATCASSADRTARHPPRRAGPSSSRAALKLASTGQRLARHRTQRPDAARTPLWPHAELTGRDGLFFAGTFEEEVRTGQTALFGSCRAVTSRGTAEETATRLATFEARLRRLVTACAGSAVCVRPQGQQNRKRGPLPPATPAPRSAPWRLTTASSSLRVLRGLRTRRLGVAPSSRPSSGAGHRLGDDGCRR
ncbi:hypothetical protein ACRAWF_12360 [Streptomyces sp. L7]